MPKKFALIGAGKSARNYLKKFDVSLEDFDVYSSIKGEILESKETNNLCKLKTKHYEKIIIAVYNYREILVFLLDQWNENTFWFNSLTSELTEITEEKQRFLQSEITRISDQRSDNGFKKKFLLAIYDFFDLPFSNDILTFLSRVELFRKKNSIPSITLAFVAHKKDPSPPRHNYITPENFKTYLYNLGIESTKLFPNIGSIFCFSDRNEWDSFFNLNKSNYIVFPEDYNINLPSETLYDKRLPIHCHRPFQENAHQSGKDLPIIPPKDAIERARYWLLKNIFPYIPITITLRSWDKFGDSRNSELNHWQTLVSELKHLPIKFILLKDYYDLNNEVPFAFGNTIFWDEPLSNLALRSALYQESTTNISVVHGATACMIYNIHTNYILFNILNGGRGGREIDLKKLLGLSWGDQFIGANKFQRLIWEPIETNLILKETQNCMNEMFSDNKILPEFYYIFNEHESNLTKTKYFKYLS